MRLLLVFHHINFAVFPGLVKKTAESAKSAEEENLED
jgi:hypothetical protein